MKKSPSNQPEQATVPKSHPYARDDFHSLLKLAITPPATKLVQNAK